MRGGCEETDDWRWRFTFGVGERLWEWLGRGSLGISEDMCRSVFDDGVEKVMKLGYA